MWHRTGAGYQRKEPAGKSLRDRAVVVKSNASALIGFVGVTHLSIGVIIYLEGLSVRHPKGARSIGIGHPRSGDRCTKTLPYPLDPLWVAEQSLQRPRQGVAHTSQSISATPYGVAGSLAMPDPRVVGATPLDPGLDSGTPVEVLRSPLFTMS